MKVVTKTISMILAVLLISSLFAIAPLTASASQPIGDYVCQLNDDGTAEIIGYIGSEKDVSIPGELEDHTVTHIGKGAFSGCETIENVTIPDSITYIASYAFDSCSNLRTVYYLGSEDDWKRIYIGDHNDCLTSANISCNGETGTSSGKSPVKQPNPIQVSGEDVEVNLGEVDGDYIKEYPLDVDNAEGELVYTMVSGDEKYFSVNESTGALMISTSIGKGQYTVKIKVGALGNENYQSKYIAQTITITVKSSGLEYEYCVLDDGTAEIYNYKGPSNTEITIPSQIDGYSVSSLRCGLFLDYPIIEIVNIPACVTEIEPFTFDFLKIKTINVSPDNACFSSLDGNLYNKDFTKLIQYSIGKEETEFTLPDSVTNIGYASFSDSKLKTVKISDNLTTIEAYAFSHCKELESIKLPNKVEEISYHAFCGCTSLEELTIPAGTSKIGYHACGFIEVITDNKIENFKIKGNSGSEAERYAEENGIAFVKLDSVPTSEEPTESIKSATETTESTEDNSTEPTTSENIPSEPSGSVTAPTETTTTDNAPTEPSELTTLPTEASTTEHVSGIDEYGYCINSYYLAGKIQGVDNGLTKVAKNLIFTKDERGDLVLNDVELKAGDCVDVVLYKGNNTFEIRWEDKTISEDGKYRFSMSADASSLMYSLGDSGTRAVGYGDNNAEKKPNPVKISVKNKTIKAKKLKKKAQSVKPITIKSAQGKVSIKITGAKKTIKKYLKFSSKGTLTIKRWTKAKKGTYKIKVKITAKGNKNYKLKSLAKTVTIKVK